MSERFELKITIPEIDEFTIPQFEGEFNRCSYKKEYYHSFAFPNKVEYTFGILTDTGYNNLLKKFRVICNQIFEEEYKKYIRYSVISIK